MLDIKVIRENPKVVRNNLKTRGDPEKIEMLDELIKSDKKWREVSTEVNGLRQKRNVISNEIAQLKKDGEDPSSPNMREKLREASRIPKAIKKLEAEKDKLRERIDRMLLTLPNLLHESVPVGKDDSGNVEIRRWGKVPEFDFEPKNHMEIMLKLGLVDAERSAKVTGHGFLYLKGQMVLLDLAILRFAVDFLVKRGYLPIEPPFMLRRKPYEGVVDLADFENVMYKIEGDDLYLIATSEHPMATMFMDEVVDRTDLPIKLVGISPCFRREVGAHGKYTKGLFRMHQFNKVEQFIFCLPEQSWQLHEELQKNSEEMYQALGLCHRIVNVCTGDIGTIAAKKYDIEVWMADGKFREAGSNSNCTDYQARRLNIRFRERDGQPPMGFVHTLNNTGLATSRTMMAILEQNQQKDGSVVVPEALRPFMGGIEKLEKR